MYTWNKRSKIAFSSAPVLDCDHEAEAFLEMAQGLETEPERGKADVAAKWSDGALDGYEKLTQGTHTLTVIATDKSGNSTEKTITFIVTSEGDTADVVIDEEALCPDLVEPESSEEPTSSNTPESSEEIASSEKPEESELESSQQKQSQENTSMEQSESGCGSALVGSLGMPLMLLGTCALFKRKKK